FEVVLPRTFPVGDDLRNPGRSTLELFEDGVPLGPAHAPHDEISSLGQGRFSHWDRSLLFSSSDGMDPRHSGPRYVALAMAAPTRTVDLDERLRSGEGSTQTCELPAIALQDALPSFFEFVLPRAFPVGDDLRNPGRSTLELFEDGVPLGPAHAPHD